MLMIMEIVSKEFDLEQLGKKCTPLKLCLVRHCNFLVLRSQDMSSADDACSSCVRIHRIQGWFER